MIGFILFGILVAGAAFFCFLDFCDERVREMYSEAGVRYDDPPKNLDNASD